MRTIGEGLLESSQCPQCGTEIQADSRFTTWCSACDWNVNPGGPEPPKGRLETLRRTLAQRHGEKLLTTMSTDPAGNAGLLAICTGRSRTRSRC